MVIDIKVNLGLASSMEKASKNSLMEIFIKEIIKKVSLLGLESTIGQTEVILKVLLRKVFEVEMEYGNVPKEILTNMKESMWKIVKMAMEFLHGLLEMSIKVIIKMI